MSVEWSEFLRVHASISTDRLHAITNGAHWLSENAETLTESIPVLTASTLPPVDLHEQALIHLQMQTESIPGTHTISQTNRLPESETHILSPSALSSVAVSAHALTPAQIHMQALFSQSMPHSKSVTITEPKQAPVVTLLPISADGNSNHSAAGVWGNITGGISR